MKITLKHDYLEIILLADLAFDLGDGDRASLHLLAGPAVARMMSCHVNSRDCGDIWSERFKDHDYGVVGGAEVEFRLFDGLGTTFGALYTYGAPGPERRARLGRGREEPESDAARRPADLDRPPLSGSPWITT